MSEKEKSDSIKIVADNRQARFLYEILETYEAGIELLGTEVKSIREGKANLRDGYGLLRQGQIWLLNAHVSPHTATGSYFNQIDLLLFINDRYCVTPD